MPELGVRSRSRPYHLQMHCSEHWAGTAPTSMSWFLARFTVHDSTLMGIFVTNDSRALLEIDFDPRWNPAIPRGHKALWIRFSHAYQVTYTQGGWGQPTVAGAESVALDNDGRESVRTSGDFGYKRYHTPGVNSGHYPYPWEDDGLTRTAFDLVNFGKIDVLHAAPVQFIVS